MKPVPVPVPDRIAMCAAPHGEHDYWAIEPGEEAMGCLHGECECEPVVFVRERQGPGGFDLAERVHLLCILGAEEGLHVECGEDCPHHSLVAKLRSTKRAALDPKGAPVRPDPPPKPMCGDETVILGPDDPDRGDLALGDWMLEVSDELKRIAAEAQARDLRPLSRELRDWAVRLEGLHAWARP